MLRCYSTLRSVVMMLFTLILPSQFIELQLLTLWKLIMLIGHSPASGLISVVSHLTLNTISTQLWGQIVMVVRSLHIHVSCGALKQSSLNTCLGVEFILQGMIIYHLRETMAHPVIQTFTSCSHPCFYYSIEEAGVVYVKWLTCLR